MSRCLDAFDISTAPKLTELSYGQQKKFLLSFGLACNTALLMLDEPTNGLDIPSKSTFRKLVAESLNEEQLFIVSTHQVHDVEALIDSVVMLHRGHVLFNQPVYEITEKLHMCHSNGQPEDDDNLLYSEKTINGFSTIRRNTGIDGGLLDLELLFKAAIESPDILNAIFDGEGESR